MIHYVTVENNMATLAQIILIIACACFVDCRYMRGRHKQSSADHHAIISHTTIRDPDAVIFPRDDADDDSSKKVKALIANKQDDNLGVNKASTDSKADVPLISKVVPAVEDKDLFTNAVKNKETVVDKNITEKDAHKKTDVEQVPATINDTNATEIKIEDSANANNTTQDLSTRFGGTGNYILVPVANNQNYQPLQPNGVPYYNTQGIAAQAPTNTMPQYATNVAPNIGQNQLTPNRPIEYPAQNAFNPPQATNTLVPINVQNTYMINGQMYAAVTVPNNMEVMSPLYYVNPQTFGYQVQNNVPMYKLVTLNDGSPQVNLNSNSQFVSS